MIRSRCIQRTLAQVYGLALGVFFCASSAMAEPLYQDRYHDDHRSSPMILFFPEEVSSKTSQSEQGHVEQYLKTNHDLFGLPDDLSNLQLSHVKESLLGRHYHYAQVLNELPVEHGEIVVSLSLSDGSILKVFNNTYPVTEPPALPKTLKTTDEALDLAWADLRVHGALNWTPESHLVYLPEGNHFRLVHKTLLVVERPAGHWEHHIDARTGAILSVRDTALYRNPKRLAGEKPRFDRSTGPVRNRAVETQAYTAKKAARKRSVAGPKVLVNGTGQVFDPNPVITLMDDTLEDTDPALAFTNAYFSRTLRDIDLSAGIYTLDGPYVKIINFEAPNTAPSTSTNGIWNFVRGNNGFNDTMTYFHLDQSQRYMQSLGFSGAKGIQDAPIETDTDADNGDDNSYFSPSLNRLAFGHGGVDDNEDSDVILHEYGHAINDDINSNWAGGDTGAMGEGFGDYWAGSYKYRTPNGASFHPEWVFSWDGHNAFWDGRRLDRTSFQYDPAQTYGAHATVGGVLGDELWSTPVFQALVELLNLGRAHGEMDQIMLEAQFGLGFGLKMPDMANAIVATAQTLFPAGPHAGVYTDHFIAHNILSLPPLPKPLLQHPAGGEVLVAGSTVQVAWSSNGAPNSAQCVIEYTEGCSVLPPVYSDDMESGTNGWTTSHNVLLTRTNWGQVTSSAHSFTTSWFAPDIDSFSSQYLVSPAIALPTNAELAFWHRYEFEEGYDGGVVGISTSGSGGPWTNLGPQITQNNYDGVLDGGSLDGELAFTGDSGGFIQTLVDLNNYSGTVHFRFRVSTDISLGEVGWWVDDVDVRPGVVWQSVGTSAEGATNYPWVTLMNPGTDYCVRVKFEASGFTDSAWCTGARFELVAFIDTDGDGIPDDWESAHGLDPNDNGSTLSNQAPHADLDLDGLSNWEEYVADTLANQSNSYFKVETISPTNSISLEWLSSSNRRYNVQYLDRLNGSLAWKNALTNIQGNGSTKRVTLSTDSTQRVYRLETTLP